jgi:HK97 family phage portal protein
MGFWGRVKAAVSRKDRKGTGYELSRWAAAPPRRGTRELLVAYREMPWLRTIVSTCSDGVAGVCWRAYRRKKGGAVIKDFSLRSAGYGARWPRMKALLSSGELEEVPDHPVLSLIENPNDALPGREVVKLIQTQLDVAGETFLMLERMGGVVVGFWPLPASWVIRIPDFRMPKAERYYTVSVAGKAMDIPASEIIHDRAELDPDDPLARGVGPGFSLGDELDTDEYIARFTKNAFFNNMLPAAVVSIEGLSDTNAPAVKAFQESLSRAYKGADNAGKALITSGKTTFARLDTPFKDIQLIELRKFLMNFTRMVYRVPPEILGDITNSNRATSLAAQEIFARQVVVPRAEHLRAMMQKWLVPLFGDDIILDYDSPVPEDREHSLKVFTARPEAFSYTEWRALASYRPDPNLQGYPTLQPGQKPEDAPGAPEGEPDEPADSEEPVDENGVKADPPWASKPL